MTILTDLRNTFVSAHTEKTLYEEIKDVRYNRSSLDINSMNKLLSFEDDLNAWCKVLDIDEYSFEHCRNCNSLDYADDMRIAYDEDAICQTCIDDEYTYSEYRDTYVHYEDADDEEHYDEESDEGVLPYDYNVMRDLTHTTAPNERVLPDTAYYGVELEVEKRTSATEDTASGVLRNFEYDECKFALLKSDGSLSNGFEIVSCPGTINAHRLYWEKFFKGSHIRDLKGWSTDTAGMHIHISRSALRQLDVGKILVFINDTKNESFVNHIAGRNAESWAKKSPKKIMDCVQSSEKYSAVNTSHRNTIELRIFKSNLSKLGFFRVLEFVDALVHFVKQTSISKLQYADFLEYMEQPNIRSQYPVFYGWLTRKSYCMGKPSRKVDWSDEQSNLREIA
tara:strand:+ start:1630 stop:2811 length:1182 start_codon:yes stop_codon:yes gene_type:complete